MGILAKTAKNAKISSFKVYSFVIVTCVCLCLDGVGYSEYRFKVNKPPHSGVCNVAPRSGFSLTTKFQIYCDSWVDEDSPLSYQIGKNLKFRLFFSVFCKLGYKCLHLSLRYKVFVCTCSYNNK